MLLDGLVPRALRLPGLSSLKGDSNFLGTVRRRFPDITSSSFAVAADFFPLLLPTILSIELAEMSMSDDSARGELPTIQGFSGVAPHSSVEFVVLSTFNLAGVFWLTKK